MKNNKLITACLIIYFFSGFQFCNAQYISNRVNINVGYQTGGFLGNRSVSEGTFIFPSLYSNYENLDGFSLKVSYKCSNNFRFGISLSDLQARNWALTDSMLYKGSEVSLLSLSPFLQLHTGSADVGIWNKIRIYVELSPTAGISKLTLTNPLFDIQNRSMITEQPSGSNDLFYGLKGGVGIEASVSQFISLFLESSTGYYLISSKLYADSHFTCYNVGGGLIIKLKKNKRFFY